MSLIQDLIALVGGLARLIGLVMVLWGVLALINATMSGRGIGGIGFAILLILLGGWLTGF